MNCLEVVDAARAQNGAAAVIQARVRAGGLGFGRSLETARRHGGERLRIAKPSLRFGALSPDPPGIKPCEVRGSIARRGAELRLGNDYFKDSLKRN